MQITMETAIVGIAITCCHRNQLSSTFETVSQNKKLKMAFVHHQTCYT